jgi:hypothetical protein
MPDKKTKIQPVSDADKQTGQPSQEATDIQEVTAEQIAGMKPSEVEAYISNAKKALASATQKWQKAAEKERENEQLRNKAQNSDYWQQKAEEAEGHLRKVVDQMTQPPQTTSTPNQPPEYDPYNPEKSWRELQEWQKNQVGQVAGETAELKKTIESLREEFGTGLRTINVERYLERAIPKLGPQVDADEIVMWFNMHPEVKASTETINQAITERQAKISALADQRNAERIAAAEADAQKVQDAEGGAPWAGGAPNHEEFVKSTPAQKNAKVAEFFDKSLKASGGGG